MNDILGIGTFGWDSIVATKAFGIEIKLPKFRVRFGVLCPHDYHSVRLCSWLTRRYYGIGSNDLWQLRVDIFAIGIERRGV